ncbi:PREDICTED: putative F-box/FBD/LRR-repeat protein At3g59240 [Camelina sativa]|uniref:F-box/FBD/LRR-repeat protein At3g59240 n=1 Tax=Camelina sativa TaxID=90675 RepID=A0ABM0SN98_CAMSA|nr:PREDICTED: putative F-box/FBD/LRR-repeat protein At3g59240 [Camelina sativa]
MNSKKMETWSRRKDIISDLPEALLCHIVSFLSTKEAALTSLLSKKWRYLFAAKPNLDFDDSECSRPELVNQLETNEVHITFMRFVTRVLASQGDSTIRSFSLKCGHGIYPVFVSRWISNVMLRGISDLDLRVTVDWKDLMMPARVFTSKSLVRLRIETGNGTMIGGMHMEHVFLPKLKALYLDTITFGDGDNYLVKLISACPVLEELVMINLCWDGYWHRSVSSKTLKRLTLRCQDYDQNPDSVTFDTPNLVYFEYSDHVAQKYDIVKFDSLVEASIGLRMTRDQHTLASYGDLVGNATDPLTRISNVQILYLYASTLEALTFCCKPIPVFKKLIHLTVKTHRQVGWESLPALLKKCPSLETLVFEGLHHKKTVKCEDGDGCLCKSSSEDIRSCLSSSPVKVLKILKFGEISFYCDDTEKQKQMEQVKHFLETMPSLEQMIVCYNTRIDEDLKGQLERLVPRGASSKCSIQLICDHVLAPVYPYSGVIDYIE